MLLNPTHEITLSGLPSDVLDAYVRYKKGTRAIVMWVVQYAPSKYAGARKLPIKELARLVSSLTGKIKHLPDVIHFHFRETIAARKRLSKYFKGFRDESLEDVDTVNHEHFTSSIYSELCAICDQPKKICKQPRMIDATRGDTNRLSNLYEGLVLEDETLDDTEDVPATPDECSACVLDSVKHCPGPQKDICLADDDLGNALEFATALQEIHDTLSALDDVWRHAAHNDINFVSAAFATHVGFATLLQVENRLRELDEHISNKILQQQCCILIGKATGGQTESSWHHLLDRLSQTQQAIDHHIDHHQEVDSRNVALQKPSDHISASDDGPSTLTPALLKNIMALIQTTKAPNAIVRNSTPVYADLGYALFNHPCAANKLKLNLSMHLLSRSYEAYVLSAPQPLLVTKCRLAALKLAQSAASSVRSIIQNKDCFPCRCSQTIAFHLQSLEEDLTAFAKQKQWDLYFQSPYVCGSHILEILDLCSYYGSKLFVYRYYIGAVVHSYNVLRQFLAFEKIPLLEYLCETFKDTWFPGGQRPTKSFRASWTRYIGARLKFKKGHRRNRQDSWCMAIPAHAARKAAGLGVGRDELKPEKGECMLLAIKQQDYAVSDDQWQALNAQAGHSNSVKRPSEHDSEPHRLASMLPILETNLGSTKSMNGGPSKLRLNHFDVFRDCVNIVSKISDATHTDAKERGMNCICFASAILEGADRIVDARATGKIHKKGFCWTKDERDGVLKTTMEAIRTVLEGKSASSWAWNII